MAAELSSGILALALVSDAPQPVSMLVLEMKGSFSKKARTKVHFICEDGKKIERAIHESLKTGDGKTVEVSTVGFDEEGDEVARFVFTWTFKPKAK
jgi:hypothetical protein